MKKICFVTTVSLTVKAFFIPIFRYLKANTDWDLTVICDEDPELGALLPEGVRYIPVRMERGISLSALSATRELKKIFRREKFDMVQYSTPNAALYAAIAAHGAKIPHRRYHLMGFRYLGFSGVKGWLFKTIEKLACRLSTDIECVSSSNLELGVREGIFPREKASVLFHGSTSGVDLTRFDMDKKQSWRAGLRSRYGYGDETCVFGFAGRITGDKGINELLRAFQSLENPNARLFLVGSMEDDGSLDPEVLSRAKEDGRITFHDFVEDIQRYFAMMDVLVLPSYREGFGNIVIEAQAMGVPVIVTDIPGPTDAMEPGKTGLTVPVRDEAALKAAMTDLAASREKRESMGSAGRLLVEERFDQQKLCREILRSRTELLTPRKKVCLISTVVHTNETFLLPMARYFHENTDWEITMMCSADDPEYPGRVPGELRFIELPMKRGISPRGMGACRRMYQIFKKEKFDMIQYCTPNASLYASLAGKRAKIPVRLYCQWGMYFVSFTGGVKRWVFKTIEKITCGASTHVQPDSFGNLELCHELKLYSSEKGSVVWNGSTCGIDLARFDISKKQQWRQEIRRQWNIPQDAWVFGFVGRINGDKGVNELLGAFRRLSERDPKLYLLMLGTQEKLWSLDRELLSWGENHPRVIMCGYQHGVERYLAAMDCYVLPSYREGFGTSVIEAEAMEVPVVSTDIQGPRESMCHGQTGILVKPRDTDALLEGMEHMLAEPELCRSYGKEGRKYVAERFELQRFLHETLEDRKRLLEQGK